MEIGKRIRAAILRRDRMRRLHDHVVDVLAHDPAASISLETMADVAGTARHHLVGLFAHHTGRTPAAFVRFRRLAIARRLLETGDLRAATDLAAHCGYENLSAFVRAFRREHDITPGRLDPSLAVTRNDVVTRTVRLGALRWYALPAHGPTAVVETFDHLLARMDVAGAPRAAQRMCAILAPDGSLISAAVLASPLLPRTLGLPACDLRPGRWTRLSGLSAQVRRTLGALPPGDRDTPFVLRYLGDPAFTPPDERRTALYRLV